MPRVQAARLENLHSGGGRVALVSKEAVMTNRTLILSVISLAACTGRPTGVDGGRAGGLAGVGGGFSSSGGGSVGGGTAGGSTAGGSTAGGSVTGGGSATGGGTTGDGGLCPNGIGWNGTDFSVGAARCANFCREHLEMRDVVVTGIDELNIGNQGDVQALFWVQDTRDNRKGMWVFKDYNDLPKAWRPQVGDLLNVRGFFKTQFSTWDRYGHRRHVGTGCNAPTRNDGGILVIEHLDGGVMSMPVTTMPGFGNANGGTDRPNPELASTRVFIPGPVTLTSATPLPLSRIGVDGGVQGYNGFEITGGVLVNNYVTFGTTRDGGSVRCDWRAIAADGGTVTFPNGLGGIWDTYTHAPCIDNPSCAGNRDAGTVPFANNQFTYVLYPLSCDELQGQVQ